MPRWSKSNLNEKKGQFFVISVVIVAVSLVTISNYLSGYSEVSLSEVHTFKEVHQFRNLKEQLNKTVLESGCVSDRQPRKRDLQNFKILAEKKMREKGTSLNITYTSYCPTAVIMTLKTSDLIIRDQFELP